MYGGNGDAPSSGSDAPAPGIATTDCSAIDRAIDRAPAIARRRPKARAQSAPRAATRASSTACPGPRWPRLPAAATALPTRLNVETSSFWAAGEP